MKNIFLKLVCVISLFSHHGKTDEIRLICDLTDTTNEFMLKSDYWSARMEETRYDHRFVFDGDKEVLYETPSRNVSALNELGIKTKSKVKSSPTHYTIETFVNDTYTIYSIDRATLDFSSSDYSTNLQEDGSSEIASLLYTNHGRCKLQKNKI